MRKLIILVLALGLVAVACNGSSEDTTTTSPAEDVTTSAATDETTTDAADLTTTTAADTTTTAAAGAGGGGSDCLVGTWVLDSDAFVENFSAIFAEAGMAGTEVAALDGSFTVEMSADGSLTGTRDAWGFNIVTEQGTVILEINGTETGTWSADDSTLEVTTDASDLTVNASMDVDGQVIEMPQDQLPIETPPGIASNSEYTCSGDVLTLTNAGVESVLNRA